MSGEGMESPHSFPHTLPYESLPSGCSLVFLAKSFNKLVNVHNFLSSVSHSNKLIEPWKGSLEPLSYSVRCSEAQLITWACNLLSGGCVFVCVCVWWEKGQSCGTEPISVGSDATSRKQCQNWVKRYAHPAGVTENCLLCGNSPHVWWPKMSEVKCSVWGSKVDSGKKHTVGKNWAFPYTERKQLSVFPLQWPSRTLATPTSWP